MKSVAVISLFVCFATHAVPEDPRSGMFNVQSCVDTVKRYLDSSEYNTNDKDTAIIASCREADSKCVESVNDHLPSLERHTAAQMLPLVRACKVGVGGCFEAQTAKMSSIDYADSKKALELLKKCE